MPSSTRGPNLGARFIAVTSTGIVLPIPEGARYNALRIDPVGGSRHVFYRLGTSALLITDVLVWGALRYAITIGVKDTGDTYRATLGGVNFDYVALGGDTNADVATALAALIDVNAAYTASAVGTLITVDAADDETQFTAAVAMLATGGGTGTISATTPIQGGDQFMINGYPDDVFTGANTHICLKTETGQTATVAIQATQRALMNLRR